SILEERVLQSSKLSGAILRYGFFYGRGTWYAPDGSSADQVRKQQTPIIGKGTGVWSFVHIDDAVAATVSAVERPLSKGALYNVTDDTPLALGTWLPSYAHWLGAPPPKSLSIEDARSQLGEDAVYYATMLRGASNRKAKAELDFSPRALEWMETH